MTRFPPCLVGLSWLLCGLFAAADAGELVQSVPAAGNAWHIACADVTGDGQPEVLYACYDGKVCCQDARTGRVLWQYATGAFPYDLTTGDLDGDGRAETLVASADGRLYTIGPDGALLWKHTTRAPLYQVALARVTRAVWVLTGGVDRNLCVLGTDGSVLKTLPQREVVRLIAAGDLDGDGRDELVLASHVGLVQALKGAGLNVLWRLRLRPIVGGHEIKTPWRPYSLDVADLDGDGRGEVLLGSGFYNRNGIRVVDHRGKLLWDKPEGFYFRDGTQYCHTAVFGGDVTEAPGREMVALNARRLYVFDQHGQLLTQAASSVSFTDMKLAPGRRRAPELWLASSPNGDDRLYRVRFARGWEQDFAALDRQGMMRRITENLARLRRQILAYRGTAPRGAKYVHVVTAGQPVTPQQVRSHFGVIDFYRRQFPYPSCVFAMSITVAADQLVPGFFNPDRRTRGRRLPPEKIVALLRVCEEAGVPFLVNVGHGCEPQIRLETVEAILRVCPRYCLGFTCSENSRYGDRLDHYLRDYWFPLMDLCKKEGKKALLIEKGAWWATVPAMRRFRRLADGTYRDVLVMSVEDSNSRSPELNLAGRAGLFLAGAVGTWSARTISDELCWNRYWEWEFPQTGHPFLRRQIAQALLGARFFEYHITMHGRSPRSRPAAGGGAKRAFGFTTIGAESIELLIHMLGKGLLIPPVPSEMLGIAPCVIRMREPNERFLAEAFNFHRHREWAWDPEEAASPLEGLACHWGAAPVRPNYIGQYLLEQDRHYGTFVPATPFGFPVIVPASVRFEKGWQPAAGCETDGRWLYLDGRRISGVDGRAGVMDRFKRAASKLPFRAEGHVFLQAQRLSDRTVRLTLIDPGFLDPGDRQVTLHLPAGRPVGELVDLLSGRQLQVRDDQAKLTVPAGSVRILEARF